MKRKFISKNPGETKKIGREISKLIKKNSVVLLTGALGAGKTVLVKGICEGLKVTGFVNSPSFKLINEYHGKIPVYHIDLYRLNSEADIDGLGLDDYLFGGGVTLIEWAEKLAGCSPAESGFRVNIKSGKDGTRLIELEKLKNDNSRD